MFHGIIFKKTSSEDIRHTLSAEAPQLVLDRRHHHIISKSVAEGWFAQETSLSSVFFTEVQQPRRAVIVAWARLDNREELILRFQLNTSVTSAELILQLYFIAEEKCPTYLLGDFSFAIYDVDRQYLFCARDPMGIKPLYYYHHPLGFAFSTSIRFFHLLGTPKPRLEWVCKKLTHVVNTMPFEDTVYHQIHRCLPAYYLERTPHTFIQTRYFTFHTDKVRFNSSNEYVDYYRSHFDKAVQRRAKVSHPLGAELSGGLDSSSITACALQHYPRVSKDFHTFSFALDADEPSTIFSINQRYALSSAFVCSNPMWYIDYPLRACQVFGAPAHHSAAIQFEIFYQQAQRLNVRTLLSGFGGDECISERKFQLYLYELLANKQYRRILQDIPGNVLTRKFRGARFIYLNHKKPSVQQNVVQKNFQARWHIASIVSPVWEDHYQLKAAYDHVSQFTQGYNNLNAFILNYSLLPCIISARAEECTLMASTYGIEYVFPLLDIELIQCYLSIPSHEKYHRGQQRYLHRRAVSHTLPDRIVSHDTKETGARAAVHHRNAFVINDDLHPALLAIIQKEKLWRQSQQLKHATAQDLTNPLLFQASRNIHTVNALDCWLKHFYPDGCEWQV